MHHAKPLAILFGALLLLAACAAPVMPRERFYRLDPLTTAAAAPTFEGIVEVERFTADGLAAQRPLVYTEADSPHQAFAYHYHAWEQAPGVMFQNLMVDSLRAGGVGDSVVTPDLRVRPDYVVDGRILRLERAIGAAAAGGGTLLDLVPTVGDGPSTGVLHLELVLRRASDDALLHQGVYREDVAAEQSTVAGTVAALNRAAQRAIERFLADLAAR